MAAKKEAKFKKDLLISVLGHLALVSLIVIVNPSAGMFKGTPTHLMVGTIDLGGSGDPGSGGPAAKAQETKPEEAKSIIPPPASEEAIPDEVVEEKLEPEMSEELAEIIPEKPLEKPKVEKKKEDPKPQPKKQETKVQDKKGPESSARSDKTSDEPKESTPKAVTQDGKTGVDVDASVGTGDGTGGGGNYNLPYNIGLLTNRISRAWRNPVSSVETMSCTIYFQIDTDGRLIGEPVIERSSGTSAFDQSALMAIRRVGVFPAFPPGFEYEFIGLHLDFEYVP